MPDPLRIALVAEGPTDRVVIEAAFRATLADRTFVLTQLQPEQSKAFGPIGTGWVGVYRRCKQAAKRGAGHLGNDGLVRQFDLLILHLDADVADASYDDGSVAPESSDGALPCARPCPPASDTSDALRRVLLSWCGENVLPSKTVVCMPSKSVEAWVLAALFPRDRAARKGIECLKDPESRFGQQPKKCRIRKRTKDYRAHSDRIMFEWP